MGDVTLAADIIEGVVDIMIEVGSTHTFRIITYGAPNPSNPGAPPSEVIDDTNIEAYTFDFNEEYMPDANVTEGELMGILSIDPLSQAQIAEIKPGSYLIDGSDTYSVIKSNIIQVAGVPSTAIVQLKG
ncbi:MAG: hypothetical protein ABUK08_00025 [Candidatus Humimicrobiaceae bacterium]